ncbi:hypothetical protein PIB30_047523 [Stylosanthes scabra]|uniref:Uncharacterized protein n=1 Tax=Stylosanthes scabra TaxID=79078 RepID=A0ABU6YFJ0_9FABA|nr:hypothetical protein [Stylosanthes scabra]
MAGMSMKIMSIVLFLALVSQCNGNMCEEGDVSGLNITQTKTGRQVHGINEWQVDIITHCLCSYSDVVLNCSGFKTLEPIDPSLLRIQGKHCILKQEIFAYPLSSASFKYAWNTSFPLNALSARTACP